MPSAQDKIWTYAMSVVSVRLHVPAAPRGCASTNVRSVTVTTVAGHVMLLGIRQPNLSTDTQDIDVQLDS